MLKKIKTCFLFIVCFLAYSCSSTPDKVFVEDDINIIPKPETVILGSGNFKFKSSTYLVVESEIQHEAANILAGFFQSAQEWQMNVVEEGAKPYSNYVEFVTKSTLALDAYELSVTGDAVSIYASSPGGFLYGVQTIRQLLPVKIESKNLPENVSWVIPQIEIKDEPRFGWRGLMLDVSRHFFPKEYIKEVIDGLAMHKMNVLHFHLVDDQGWRIEIKKYPKLTEVGAWRVDHEDKHWNARPAAQPGEEATYGGFYTQEDIKEIVAYAASKNIEVVPEIEMPAHVSSAVAAYPELSCNETQIQVPSGGVWPITDIYCAGKDQTFDFLENVLIEVMELFPSQYIHIGGDEATKTNWKTCGHCQARMKNEGLKTEEELQSYFIKRMERFISSKGRTLIGWDEILEGGLAPGATVMSWRGVKGGLEAAGEGHDVIMTPNSHCYFDHYQGPQDQEPLAIGGYLPLSKVYKFDPVVEGMTKEEANHVLGGQANLWSEYIPTTSHSQYMIYPRLAALAEAVWSPKENKDWNDFSGRIETMFTRYGLMGINYAKSAYLLSADSQMDMESKTVGITLNNELPNSDIRYSVNGSPMQKFEQPIQLTETTTIKALLYKNDKPAGKEFNKTIKFHQAVGKKPEFKTTYHKSYQGTGDYNLVNALRGTKNFHDGQWQAWLGEDMEATIDLGQSTEISKVTVGAMESQGPQIYFPTDIEVYLSKDGEAFEQAGKISRPYAQNASPELKDFVVDFEKTEASHVNVKAIGLKKHPLRDGSVWLFVDEILVE